MAGEIAWGDAGFLAIGRRYEGGEGGPRIAEYSIWQSADGREWTQGQYPSPEGGTYIAAALTGAVAETLRCRAAVRLKLYEDAIQSLADVIELLGNGDIAADEEIAVAAVATASELFAPLGEVELAGRLDAVRRQAVEGWPVVREDDEAHDDWLRSHGVVTANEPDVADLGVALDLIRDWLRNRRADA